MSTIQTQLVLVHLDSGLTAASSFQRTTEESGFSADSIAVTSTESTVAITGITVPRQVALKLISGDDVRVGFATGNYPLSLHGLNDAMLLNLESREVSSITCAADSGSSLSGLYFDMADVSGALRVWFNMVATTASSTLTLTANATDGETVTLGDTTYTFKTALSSGPAVANEVLIGSSSASESIDNLIAAIAAGAGSGTAYGTGTTANASATAVAGAGDTMIATAIEAGTAGNSILIGETLANGSWTASAVLLTGGSDASAAPAVPTGGRLLPVVIVENSTNTVVGAAVRDALNADGAFLATLSTATLTITDAAPGARANIAAGTSTFTGASSSGSVSATSVYLKSLGTSQVVVAVAPA